MKSPTRMQSSHVSQVLLAIHFLFITFALGSPPGTISSSRIAALLGQPIATEECDIKYGRPGFDSCDIILQSLGGRTLSLDNYRPYRFFHSLRNVVSGQLNIALPYTRTFRDCAIFIDTPEHIASADPAENQWDTTSWNDIKSKAQIVNNDCVNTKGSGGSIPIGVAGRLRIHLVGPDSSFLADYARVHPNSMRRRPGGSSAQPQNSNVGGFIMPTTDAGNAATVCHSSADCEQGSSCPVDEASSSENKQEVDEETIYGRALGMAVATCMVMMKGNGLGP
ncbi:MAG: hypothetical protein M1812_001396 [Candelaria pacifica]|nr:MAG: hypothetical protein M1812_001396 [Candelaria pacifica]